MTKEEIIEELEEMKAERMNDLTKINVKHDMLVEHIAELNYIIQKARDENARSIE